MHSESSAPLREESSGADTRTAGSVPAPLQLTVRDGVLGFVVGLLILACAVSGVIALTARTGIS